MSERERYRLKSAATAIDDWLICHKDLNASEYRMACHILRHQKNGDPPPTRDDLAKDMQVDPRSVARWLERLRDLGVIESSRDGRRNVYSFLKPRTSRKGDKKITDHSVIDKKITDPSITDPSISDRRVTHAKSRASGRHVPTTQDHFVTPSPVGVGVGSNSSKEEDSPTTNAREPLKTDLGRYMARRRFMAAPQFDDPSLDCAAHVRAIEEMERQGLNKSQIVYFLQLDPPVSESYPPQAPAGEELIEELPTEESPIEEEEALIVDSDDPQANMIRLWNRVLGTLQIQTSRNEFNTWLRRTSLITIENGIATIGAPSAFFKEGIENRYLGTIRDLIGQLYVPIDQIRVVIGGAR
jgi:DNA-binding MarR family transcriptional regulator